MSASTDGLRSPRQIASAKETWALEKGKGAGTVPLDGDLFGANLYVSKKPTCPGGGDYTLGVIGILPICSRSALGHLLLDGDGAGTADAIASSQTQPPVPVQPAAAGSTQPASATATTSPDQSASTSAQGQGQNGHGNGNTTGSGQDQSHRENK